jgi:hypothetical protein
MSAPFTTPGSGEGNGPRTAELLLRAAAGGAFPEGFSGRLAPEQSARLVDAALREGLAGCLRQGLRRAGRRSLIEETAGRRLDAFYYLTLNDNLRKLAALREVLSGMRASGVDALLVQGAALLVTHYRDPGLRPLTDIDLWVAPASRAAAAAVLARLGFHNTAATPALYRNGRTLFDLHTDLLGAERIGARRFLLEAGHAKMIQAACRVDWEGLKVRCLSPCDQVIHLAHHAVKHNFERLIWLADLRSLVADWPESAWAAFYNRSEELGQGRVVSLLRYALEMLLGFRPPRYSSAPGRLSAAARHLVRRRRKGPLPAWACLVLLPPEKLLDRVRFVCEFAFPRPEILRQVFPGPAPSSPRQLRILRLRQIVAMLPAGMARPRQPVTPWEG